MSQLTPPKRNSAGYYMTCSTVAISPEVKWGADGHWILNPEWSAWAAGVRNTLLGELLSHGNWFSRPPRRDILEPMFGPWSGKTLQGTESFFCKCPDVPGEEGSTGTATWKLEGLMMTSVTISPVWSIVSSNQDEMVDTISLFGDGDTVDGSDDDGGAVRADETREVQIDEIEDAPPAEPTRFRGREWEARKFLAKERVREARLKAQLAEHIARKEESRFYRQYGDLDDGESHFSEYDLSTEDSSSDSSLSEVELE
jgi:hypothetical protein